MLKLGWFSTGRGEGSLGLLRMAVEAIQSGELDASLEFVFSNREPGEAEGSDRYFQQVRDYGIPLACRSSQRFRRERGVRVSEAREAYDREVLASLGDVQPDLCVLAGYMLILSGELCRAFPFINLHPALPDGPAGTWQEVIWQLIAGDAVQTGSTIHLATEELDAGPAIAYTSFPIRGSEFDPAWEAVRGRSVESLRQEGESLPLFRLIREEGVRRERPLLLETLKILAQGAVRVEGGALSVQRTDLAEPPLCLNPQVEARLAATGGR